MKVIKMLKRVNEYVFDNQLWIFGTISSAIILKAVDTACKEIHELTDRLY